MFEKLPSGYRLTAAGEEVFELAEQMEASSHQLETRVFGRDQSVRGLVVSVKLVFIRDVAKALIGVSARVESSGTIDGLDDGAATVIAAVKPGAFGAPLRGCGA